MGTPKKQATTFTWTWVGAILATIALSLVARMIEQVSEGSSLWTFASRFFSCLVTTRLWRAVGETLGIFSIGFLLGMSLACLLGLAMGRNRRIESLMNPSVGFLKAIPSAAVIPLAMLVFSYGGLGMKVFIIAYGVMWPVLLQVFQGCKDLDQKLIDTGRTLGKGRLAIFWFIVLPATLPNILTGARVGLGIGLLLAVTTELILGRSALGFLILDYERSFKHAEMLAVIAVLGLLGAFLDFGFRKLERITVPWVAGRKPS